MSEEIELKVGQRWVHKTLGRTLRIMAIAEGYCMVRYKGGAPWVLFGKHLQTDFGLSQQHLKRINNGKETNT